MSLSFLVRESYMLMISGSRPCGLESRPLKEQPLSVDLVSTTAPFCLICFTLLAYFRPWRRTRFQKVLVSLMGQKQLKNMHSTPSTSHRILDYSMIDMPQDTRTDNPDVVMSVGTDPTTAATIGHVPIAPYGQTSDMGSDGGLQIWGGNVGNCPYGLGSVHARTRFLGGGVCKVGLEATHSILKRTS